jgi:L-lactate dehydrogenase complex protein LldF
MAVKTASDFLVNSGIKAKDVTHRKKINFNIGRYNAVVPLGKAQFAALEYAREKAKNIKWQAINELDKTLETFEKNAIANGTTVLWANDVSEAQQYIKNICAEAQCKTVVKSKSMVTEEIQVNHFLESLGIESVETDLGEYIQQLDGEPPYHIVTPAMHKSKEDVAILFNKHLGTPLNYTPEQLTLVARKKLREKYVQAQVGITGGNFLIADTGSIALTENEGNARLSCAWPNIHIAIVGIEKVIPSIEHLNLFWPLLATFGTGQKVTVYNSIISGPRKSFETDGPEKMYVILLDNGRTNLLANPKSREALYCIRCGACLNACPVYKNIGGHAYDTTYSGPIGSIITPHLRGMKDFKHLSYASSLCGNCTEVCAVKINLHELLLENRKESIEQKEYSYAEKIAWKLWKNAMLNRKLMNAGNASIKNFVINKIVGGWNKERSDINFPKETFNEIMRKKLQKT